MCDFAIFALFNLQPFAASLAWDASLAKTNLTNLESKVERGRSPGSARAHVRGGLYWCMTVHDDRRCLRVCKNTNRRSAPPDERKNFNVFRIFLWPLLRLLFTSLYSCPFKINASVFFFYSIFSSFFLFFKDTKLFFQTISAPFLELNLTITKNVR